MDYLILILPVFAWFTAGTTKFLVNSVLSRSLATNMVGLGGWPSNHSTIVSSVFFYLLFSLSDPKIVLVSFTVMGIVCIDASGLRRHVGRQAQVLNKLARETGVEHTTLRERVGHTEFQIISGICIGCIIGFGASYVF
jgi:uncharacterized protein